MTEPLKFALIGSAPASIQGAPYADPTWQVWGCSPGAYGVVPKGRSNIWWELHRYEPGQPWFSPEYCQFLRDHPCVIVAEARKEIPNGVVLDYDYLARKYSPFFFTSSIAWMMAHAIELIEHAGDPPGSKIGLWGVDMAANEEYEAQRAGLHYFAMIADKKGIEVGVPPESDLFRPRFLYGIDETKHFHIKMRARRVELEQRLMAAEQMVAQKQQECFFLKGALDDLNYCFHTWPDKSSWLAPRTFSPEVDLLSYGGQIQAVPTVTEDAPPERKRRTKPNGRGEPLPVIAEARLGPGRFV
jgi:hypothetical protein